MDDETITGKDAENAGERHSVDTKDAFFYMLTDVYRFLEKFAVNKDVVELGSGTGFGADLTARFAKTVRAFEIDPDALKFARRAYKRPNLTFSQADLSKPFDCEPANVVFSSNVFEHLLEPQVAVQSAVRCLKEDGRFVLAVPCIADFKRLNWEHRNPHHISNWWYDLWEKLLRLNFDRVEKYIQRCNYDNGEWDSFPQDEKDRLQNNFSSFKRFNTAEFDDLSETGSNYANVVFVCWKPKQLLSKVDLPRCPVSATRRIAADHYALRGWSRTLNGNDAISYKIRAKGWIGGLDLLLGDAGLRSQGSIGIDLTIPYANASATVRRHVVPCEALLVNQPTPYHWSFYREPVWCDGDVELKLSSVGIGEREGFNVGISDQECFTMRLWETYWPLPV